MADGQEYMGNKYNDVRARTESFPVREGGG